MTAAAFDAVVFDLYGTLVYEFDRGDFYDVVREMGLRLGADPSAFRGAWDATAIGRQTGEFPDMEANLRAVGADLGLPLDDEGVAEALALRAAMYARYFRPRPGALETLTELKDRGYPIALVSMCAPDTPALWRASALAPFVDIEVFSSEVGLRKPDAAIYQAAADGLLVEPERCLYCGDGAYGELTGAEAVGMTAVLIEDPDVDQAASLRPEGETWTGDAAGDLRDLLDRLPSLT